MFEQHLGNPLNKRKKKYKFILRILEDFVKKIFFYFFLLPIILPFLIFNSCAKRKYYFKDFSNHNGIVFFVFILKEISNSKFIINISDFHLALSRFGLFFFIKNFSIKSISNFNYSISLNDKNCDYYLNQNYFKYFDDKVLENKNNFVLPFYLPKTYYLKDKMSDYKKLIKSKKKFKIIFSGSTHNEWYGGLNFTNVSNKKFLNRQEILGIIKKNYKDKILIINQASDLNKIENINKEILIIETNPAISLRKKNFSEIEHLKLISESNFFLCMPGTSMPICYHLIESCLVGTVPILSYNDYLSPKFKNNEAIFFFNEDELIVAIDQALKINYIDYSVMQKKIIEYYDKNLSPDKIKDKLINKSKPIEIFINLDHESSKLKNQLIQR